MSESASGAGAPEARSVNTVVVSPRSERQQASVQIYDTTLRDGIQLEGISVTVDDKLRIAEQLDHLGVHFIEGGWPGSNPKDDEFFARAPSELKLSTSTLVAFGSTRRVKGKADDDPTLRNLVKANTSAVCIVGKCWDYHVTEALRTSLDEGIAMVADSVEFLHHAGLRVFYDAEHFFDGYKHNAEFSLRVLEEAARAGAEVLVLCDTNGGSLPADVERIVSEVYDYFGGDVGIGVHLHDDTGCGTANALAGVRAGAMQVQGTINGIGERTGNCNLTTIIPNLSLKMGVATIPPENLVRLTAVSHHIAELVNVNLNPQAPYVGQSAFAHKAGLHVSAIARRPDAYEHTRPDDVGNGTRFVVSEMAGRSTLEMKAREIGLEIAGNELNEVVGQLKELEHQGYHFEAADGSLELLMRGATGWEQSFFTLESFRVIVDHRPRPGHENGSGGTAEFEVVTEATIKVLVDGERIIATAEGNGPINALDQALRQAIGSRYPALDKLHLTDFKVRVLDTSKATGAVTRVLIDSTNGDRSWSTIGVSENIIEAAWEALLESIIYGLVHAPSGSDEA
jgi:2-isopropylmalate synthase